MGAAGPLLAVFGVAKPVEDLLSAAVDDLRDIRAAANRNGK